VGSIAVWDNGKYMHLVIRIRFPRSHLDTI
jgi:hypothetical protein